MKQHASFPTWRMASLSILLAGGLVCSTPALLSGTTNALAAPDEAEKDDTAPAKITQSTAEEPAKAETVFVKATASGNPHDITVNAWLQNANREATLYDISTLDSIEVTEGDFSFTPSGESGLEWNAQGSDIHYQGTSRQETPITMNVSYFLDGAKIQPEGIAGKSGHVRIRFDYENHSTSMQEIDGVQREMYTPFVVATGLILDGERFHNIELSNGQTLTDDERTIVMGLALPGMKSNFEGIDTEDLDFSDYFEIEADVDDFKLDTTLTAVTNSFFDDIDDADLDFSFDADFDELKDALSALSDGGNQLESAMQALLDGANGLGGGMGQLKDGAQALDSQSAALNEGASGIAQGIYQLTGAQYHKKTDETTYDNSDALRLGAQGAATGAQGINEGAQALDEIIQGLARENDTTNVAELDAEYNAFLTDALEQTQGEKDDAAVMAQEAQDTFDEALAYLDAALDAGTATPDDTQNVKDAAQALNEAQAEYAQAQGNESAYQAAFEAYDSLHQALASDEEPSDATSSANPLAAAQELSAGLSKQTAELSAALGDTGLQRAVEGYTQGADALASHVGGLESGIRAYTGGVSQLSDGMVQLSAGSQKLVDGIAAMKGGTGQFVAGLNEFSNAAIDGLEDAFEGNEFDALERIQAIIRAGKAYDTYSGKSPLVKGSVTFIVETDPIVPEE